VYGLTTATIRRPSGFNTRWNSASATGWSKKWKASVQVIASTDDSSKGNLEASPRTHETSMDRLLACSNMPSDRSHPMT
jgi:hypothetical protein